MMTALHTGVDIPSPHGHRQATFDHRDAGNPPQAWQPLLDSLAEAALPPPGTSVVVLAAHPDDETLGCGAILARASDAGYPVTVIIATDGEASHPRSTTHSPATLAGIRRQEAATAVATLAPTARLVQLGLPDGALEQAGAQLREAIAAAVGTGPSWLLSTWEQDRHPDHAACARSARHVAAGRRQCVQAEYPIWAWHWGDPAAGGLPAPAMTRIPGGPDAAARRGRALRAYRSQVLPLSDLPGDEPVLAAHVTGHFDRGFDVLVDPRGSAARVGYFDALYALSDDPWGTGTRWYEQRKRALLLASLPRRRFRRAFEPGCAAGRLTVELAARCDRVVAADAASRAVALTRDATRGLAGVSVRQLEIPRQWPTGSFDLLVLSEIGYYAQDLDALCERVSSSLPADGVVVLCHWRHPAIEHPQTAEAVHRAIRRSGLHLLATHREEDFLLDVLGVGCESVARADGIVT